MAIRLKDYEGTKRLERQRDEAELWEEWRRCTWSDAITPRCDIDECIRAFRGEVITQDDIPDLKKVVEWDKSLSEDDRDYIRGLIKAVEEEVQSPQAVAFTTQEYLARRGELLAKWNSTEWIDGGYSQLRLSMPERVKAFTADVPATEALSFLQLIADQGEGMTQEERAYLREYVKQAQHPTPSIDEVTRLRNQLEEANHRIQELEAWQTFVPPTQEEGVYPFPETGIPFSPKGSTLSPREVDQAQELEQAHARITQLEEEQQQAKARIAELEEALALCTEERNKAIDDLRDKAPNGTKPRHEYGTTNIQRIEALCLLLAKLEGLQPTEILGKVNTPGANPVPGLGKLASAICGVASAGTRLTEVRKAVGSGGTTIEDTGSLLGLTSAISEVVKDVQAIRKK